MFARIAFISIVLFWLIMNVLLWRASFGVNSNEASPIPAAIIWEKLLTSPDNSSLSILHHDKKIGYCHWTTSVGEEWANVSDENVPTGMPTKIRRYQLHLEGNAFMPELTNRLRFEGSLKINRKRVWQEFEARVFLRSVIWQLHASAQEQAIRLSAEDGTASWKRVFKFSDLQNPGALARQWLGPFAGEFLADFELPSRPEHLSSLDAGPVWEGQEDTLRIGHTQVRVYRLKTRLLDRYSLSIVVSHVGEIVRMELPDEFVLVNDQLVTLQESR